MKLSLQSEKYSPTGNLAADGYKKLLGTPNLDLLQTLIREALQNSCDAAKLGIGAEVQINLRELSENEIHLLRTDVFCELPHSEESHDLITDFLENDRPWVLEICDFNTIGLAGPIRADKLPANCKDTDFIDFLRNVGSRRDTKMGGGTYGYGKSSLYMASQCSTILVDSKTHFEGNEVRRLIGCHLGKSYDEETPNQQLIRKTGRHWWGVVSDDEVADPVSGEQAEKLSFDLGMPDRSGARTGTSIMILDPWFLKDPEITPQICMCKISETILWYFWPRMVSSTPESRKLRVQLNLLNEKFTMPAPEDFAPVNLFSKAIKDIRLNSNNVQNITCSKPKKNLGRLVIQKDVRIPRVKMLPEKETIIPDLSSHIAVMRPAEYVVRYFVGDALPDHRVEWAGVFITDTDSEVEEAFATAEPPAHDDWIPDILPKGRKRTFVNVGLREIKSASKLVAFPDITGSSVEAGSNSLAHVSGKFGQFLIEGLHTNSQVINHNKNSRTTNSRKKNHFTQPAFLRLERTELKNYVIAVFETHLSFLDDHSRSVLSAVPKIVIDGGSTANMNYKSRGISVIGWMDTNNGLLSKGESLPVSQQKGDFEVRVKIPRNCAITLNIFENVIENE